MNVSVTRTITWAMGHRLQAHRGLCRHPHGHSYEAEVTVARDTPGQLAPSGPSEGMVVDFSDLDAAVKAVVDGWDHAFMVEDTDPFAGQLRLFAASQIDSTKVVEVPWAPTAENIAFELVAQLKQRLDVPLRVVSVRIHEGPRSVAEVTPK